MLLAYSSDKYNALNVYQIKSIYWFSHGFMELIEVCILLNWFWVDILDFIYMWIISRRTLTLFWHWYCSILVLTRCDFYSTSPEDASFTKPSMDKIADRFRRHFFGTMFSLTFVPKSYRQAITLANDTQITDAYIHLKVQKVKTKRKSWWLFCYGH